MASRQLLGDSAPPGDAKDIGSHVPKVVQHLDGQVRDARQPVRKSRQWRMTYAGDVKRDDLPIGHPARNGFEQLDIAPDSVEEQERYSGSLSGLPTDTQCLIAKLQHLRCKAASAVRQVRADTVIARGVHSPRPSIITDVAVVPYASDHRAMRLPPVRVTAGCAAPASRSCRRWISARHR